ncbi:hypothetical protein KYK29_10360 [Shinella daejeonensis]|uniref:hypothetical protein n=1 Tax=Shinella daejeonensis TaxID=659017 RepID=UPI0020C79EE0|nr:hypothetical protein [Shinella daejeonensis]MCP8895336.1 hypothetical protein [Shinella daejeonensis]
MPVLKNARHEKFAQALAKGKTADEAYQEAGYKPNRGNAATLKANQSISDRVAELQAGAAAKAQWTAADRLKTLSEIVERTAMTDPRVAVSAISEANKMQGSHAPAKTEVSEPGGWEQAEDKTWRQVLRSEKS